MNFLDYEYYIMGCLGVGDIICSLNALNNIGNERNRRINVAIVHRDFFRRVFDIYSAMEYPNVDIHFCAWPNIKLTADNSTAFQAFGMEVSWIKGWLYGWGLRKFLGYEYMAKPGVTNIKQKDLVGVSFTVVSNPKKTPSLQSCFSIIDEMLDAGKQIKYFGIDKSGIFMRRYAKTIRYGNSSLYETFLEISQCENFIGADSGMAWLAAFQRIPTRIVVGQELTPLPNTFSEIPWVTIECESTGL